jgi:2-dehydro-3-deoxyphosphooctonate aldolase (KDO 8-P synthase)
MKAADIKKYIYPDKNFFLIAGPCVVEGEEVCMNIGGKLLELCSKHNIPYIFKASYRKANRTSDSSFQGIGDEEALRILDRVRSALNIPVLTDVHETVEVTMAAEVADVLQIPAFLSRQTDLLKAAGKSGKAINIKKGQFMSPHAAEFALEKVRSTGNDMVMLTERGSFFGYQDLVVDFRSLVEMQSYNCPVIFDATHSLQKPNQTMGVTGGNPEYIIPLARAAMATGIQGLFVETHPEPERALSDGKNMLALNQMDNLLSQLSTIFNAIRT